MPKVNLSRMTVEALMDLRKRVEERLVEHRAQLEKQLERMGRAITGPRVVRGGRSALKEGKSRRNIEVPQAKHGRVVAQDLVGLLTRSRVERNSTTS